MSVVRPRRGRLSDLAYSHLRDAILRGELPVGSVLAEDALAVRLGSSRTPVRHALRLLLQEGLAELGPRRQLIVRGLSREHCEEVLVVREALEAVAVRRACEVMSLDDVDVLRLNLLRQRRAVDAGNEEDFIVLDEAFHLTIAAGARLPILHKFLSELRGFVRLMRLGTERHPSHLEAVLAEHEAIVDALERRDVEAALAALEHHLHTRNYDLMPAGEAR